MTPQGASEEPVAGWVWFDVGSITDARASEARRRAEVMATAHDFTGTTLSGRYYLESLLGAGAFASVYCASDCKTYGREVAIKVLHPEHTKNQDYVDRFHQEVRVAAKIATRHREHLVQIIDQGVCDAQSPALVYFVMEYIDGVSLRALVSDMRSGVRVQRHLAWQRAVSLAQQLCRAIAPLHAHGVIHRDIKPENCLIERRNDREVIKLLDLGIAKVVADAWSVMDSPNTDARMVLGTPRYMAPEQMFGCEVDRRADIYAVGVILYEFLTGKTPRRLDPANLEMGIAPAEPPLPSEVAPDMGIPPALDAAVMQAIAWRREERFSRAEALAAALEDASRTVPSRVRGITSRITQPFLAPISTRRIQASPPPTEVLPAVSDDPGSEAGEEAELSSGSRWVWASRRLGGVMVLASTVSGLVFVLALMLAIQPRPARSAVQPVLKEVELEEPRPEAPPAPRSVATPIALPEPPMTEATQPAPAEEPLDRAPRSSRKAVLRSVEELIQARQDRIRRDCGSARERRKIPFRIRFVLGSMAVADVEILGEWSRPIYPELQSCVEEHLRAINYARSSDAKRRPFMHEGTLAL